MKPRLTRTAIEWADYVWNPVSGCTKVSTGCKNCYAERQAKRFWGERDFREVRYHHGRLVVPGNTKKPGIVFVCSMGDLFHDDVPTGFIIAVLQTIATCEHHVFVVLTKRPERMERIVSMFGRARITGEWPLRNLWLGVSVEDQETANERIPLLLTTSAALHVVSAEPLLGPIDIVDAYPCAGAQIGWLIAGGESGPGARPTHSDWVRSLRDQAKDMDCPFYFKQWGEYLCYDQARNKDQHKAFSAATIKGKQSYFGARLVPGPQGLKTGCTRGIRSLSFARIGKKYSGCVLDDRWHNEFPIMHMPWEQSDPK